MRPWTPLKGLLLPLAFAAVSAAALFAGGSATAQASVDPNYCQPSRSDHPCRGCPGDPQGPCTAYEDAGRIDIGQKCCDSACVNFRSNPYGQYEDYIWESGWSYHNRVTGRNWRMSYIGGKGGAMGPWTVQREYHQPVCN